MFVESMNLNVNFCLRNLQGLNHSQAWRQYWDHQVYKALDFWYHMHLPELHKTVPDIHIELDFKQVSFHS